jgi:hypothetical protein
MDQETQKEIEALRRLKVKDLKARYRELFGEESRSSNRAHLFRRIAWRLQARAEGDLTERARERAAELAVDVDLRLRPPQSFWSELSSATKKDKASKPKRDPRLPEPGALLERKYRAQMVCVKVLDEGFEYQGKHYLSLSSIASTVSGTRWNGFSFFRLKDSQ